MKLGRVLVLAGLAFELSHEAGHAQEVLTLETYVQRAVEQGVQGKERAWELEQAGYTRDIVFHRTEAPTIGYQYSRRRFETTVEGQTSHSSTNNHLLTVDEVTPLGTTMSAAGGYGTGDQTTTDGVTSQTTEGKPLVTANASQPIYIFVKNPIARERRLADLSFADAKSRFTADILSIRSQARSSYYSVMEGQQTIKVDERKVAASQKLLDVTDALVDGGKTAPVERTRVQIQLLSDQRQLHNDEVTLQTDILNAKNYIYASLDDDMSFVTELEFTPLRPTLERLRDYGQLHQPAIEILRRAQTIAQLNLEAAVEPTRPTFSLNGLYNYQEIPEAVTHGWSWTADANWLFFDSFVTRDTVRSVRIAEWVTQLNLKDGERTADVNIRSKYLEIKQDEQEIQDFKYSLDQAQHNVEIVRLRFQNGLDRLIDVFDAENQMRDLDNEYLGLLVRFNRSKDDLSELIGTDVETLL